MNRAEKAYRSKANASARINSVNRYNEFAAKISRSRYGNPKVANNTIVWYSNTIPGGICYQLHATVLATLLPNGAIEFHRHGWYSVTTQERLRRLTSYPNREVLANAPKCPKREISWPYGETPNRAVWDYVMPSVTNNSTLYGYEYGEGKTYSDWQIDHMEYQVKRAADLHEKYGTFENWQERRREYLRECRRVAPLVREWEAKYTRKPQEGGLYYPGIGWDIKPKNNV